MLISRKRCKTQIYLQWKTNRKSYIWPIKWQQRQWPWMTLKVIHWLQAFSNAICRTFVQHFTRFELTVCSHGSSAFAELLVMFMMHNAWPEHRKYFYSRHVYAMTCISSAALFLLHPRLHQTKRKFDERAFTVAGLTVWNAVPNLWGKHHLFWDSVILVHVPAIWLIVF